MTIHQIIYGALKDSAELAAIFQGNIFPLSTKKQKLPAIIYQVEQTEVNHSKTSKSIFDVYYLRLHLFSEDYLELVNATRIIKDLLDFKELSDKEGNTVIELSRFDSYTEDYTISDEMFTQTVNFNIYVIPN